MFSPFFFKVLILDPHIIHLNLFYLVKLDHHPFFIHKKITRLEVSKL